MTSIDKYNNTKYNNTKYQKSKAIECSICYGEIAESCYYECQICSNKCHTCCGEKWKKTPNMTNNDACPVCRTQDSLIKVESDNCSNINIKKPELYKVKYFSTSKTGCIKRIKNKNKINNNNQEIYLIHLI